jgi:hypothetical protein
MMDQMMQHAAPDHVFSGCLLKLFMFLVVSVALVIFVLGVLTGIAIAGAL